MIHIEIRMILFQRFFLYILKVLVAKHDLQALSLLQV